MLVIRLIKDWFLNYIELFAGCGGLSLGLEATGFELLLANELSPMAAETYAYNLLNTNLFEADCIQTDKVAWLSSNYSIKEVKQRLREDPRTFPKLGQGYNDLEHHDLEPGQLVVADLVQLNQWLSQNPSTVQHLKSCMSTGQEVDLVSGGPPCQSFSLAGLREFSNKRNTLPWEFANFVEKIQPKVVLLENVSGILHAFNNEGGKFYAWYEVAKAFAKIGYLPLCLHVNAKYAGAAQNRPRYIFIGLRFDFFEKIKISFNAIEKTLFEKALRFYQKIKELGDLEYGYLQVVDIEDKESYPLFAETFLSPLIRNAGKFYTVKDAIDDLKSSFVDESDYIQLINSTFPNHIALTKYNNHDLRSNSDFVKKRFRVYQILSKIDKKIEKEVRQVLKGEQQLLSAQARQVMLGYSYLVEGNANYQFSDGFLLEEYLRELVTKKQTQKALIRDQPAPAALSIPDDVCHYDPQELRTLTVREMARIQSFPDWFVFRSKVTTGGQMRRFEVPQYTQVGNAVPPLLGYALGKVIQSIIAMENKSNLNYELPLRAA